VSLGDTEPLDLMHNRMEEDNECREENKI